MAAAGGNDPAAYGRRCDYGNRSSGGEHERNEQRGVESEPVHGQDRIRSAPPAATVRGRVRLLPWCDHVFELRGLTAEDHIR